MFQKLFRNLFHRFDKPKDAADFLFHVRIDRKIKFLKIMPVKYDLPFFFHKLKGNLKVISGQVIFNKKGCSRNFILHLLIFCREQIRAFHENRWLLFFYPMLISVLESSTCNFTFTFNAVNTRIKVSIVALLALLSSLEI